ncbi:MULTISPECIES: hypothetical protein [Sinorhizobium]|uniref:Uncharacterized protein n=1 Tax=Rhizobium fredii TaxID=380 RepID=A0A844A4G4_RHIFR|nr:MULTISPECIES: hypothetical protein [Sinorhizobium]MQX06992.1 hypothetical protein [Sinorhizobium fredii]CCE98717.1 hypothetical protein SFHH103_04231 [Sinorhizobium fredii HH103]
MASSRNALKRNASASGKACTRKLKPQKSWSGKKQLAILDRYNLPTIRLRLKNSLDLRLTFDPTELRSQFASQLGVSDSNAALDPHL